MKNQHLLRPPPSIENLSNDACTLTKLGWSLSRYRHSRKPPLNSFLGLFDPLEIEYNRAHWLCLPFYIETHWQGSGMCPDKYCCLQPFDYNSLASRPGKQLFYLSVEQIAVPATSDYEFFYKGIPIIGDIMLSIDKFVIEFQSKSTIYPSYQQPTFIESPTVY